MMLADAEPGGRERALRTPKAIFKGIYSQNGNDLL